MFISTACCMNRPRYSFGYKRTIPRIKKESVLLPATSDGDPDYGFMEKYMKRQESKLLGLYAANKLKEYQSEEDSKML